MTSRASLAWDVPCGREGSAKPQSGFARREKLLPTTKRLFTSNAAVAGITGRNIPASYITDGRGSVKALLSDTGERLASYSYSPFGETIALLPGSMTGADLVQGSFYGYNGESYDPVTKLQFLRARYYAPDQGRFTAKDTWAGMLTSPITQNAYIYANSDPVNFYDPSGHASL